MIIVTGGAGFIGSALVAELNRRGQSDIIVVDNLDHEDKRRNLEPLAYGSILEIPDFRAQLKAGAFDGSSIEGVLHMGACSATTETNWDYLQDNNVDYSKDLILWCADNDVRCVYASSAATYGDGSLGFSDDHALFDSLKPLNLYGESKLIVDVWARDTGALETAAGVRYFNVFGPNEWHKGEMRSVINKKFPEITAGSSFSLFKSYLPEYADGDQERDFIYVKDAVEATLWLLENGGANGVFNVGTGVASTWNEVARAMFKALGLPERIAYIEMPSHLKNQYQYHTRADIAKIRAAGFGHAFTPLEDSIADYIKNYLLPHKHLGSERE